MFKRCAWGWDGGKVRLYGCVRELQTVITGWSLIEITGNTDLIVVLQHLSDYSDLWVVVLDGYNPDAG